MGQIKGSKGRIVLDFETTYGSDPVSADGLVMPLNSETLRGGQAPKRSGRITGTRNPNKPYYGNLDVAGSIVVPVDSAAFPYWLKLMFGAPATTGSGTYTHVFSVEDTMGSGLIEKRFSDGDSLVRYAKYNGIKTSSLSLSIGGDDELLATIGLLGKSESLGSSAYDGDPTVLDEAPWEQSDAALTEGGSTLSVATQVDLNVDFGLAGDNFVIDGTKQRYNIPADQMSVTGSVTTLFESDALLTKALNNTETSLVATLTNGSDVLTITINELHLERNMPGIEGPQGILITLPFFAYVDDHVDASVIQFTVVNGEDSYA
jgi:hypothetical protein